MKVRMQLSFESAGPGRCNPLGRHLIIPCSRQQRTISQGCPGRPRLWHQPGIESCRQNMMLREQCKSAVICGGLEWGSQPSSLQQDVSNSPQLTSSAAKQQEEQSSTMQAASPVQTSQQRQQQPAWVASWRLPSPAQLRTAAYVLLGSLVAWRYATAQLRPAGSAFMSLSIASFRSASQTGISGAINSAVAGFVAGLLHTLAGADHLAALTPLTIGRSHVKASLLGALWGFGHSTGQLILGLALVVLKDRFEAFVPTLSRWGGLTVGLSLVAIGLMGLLELYHDHRAAHSAQPALEGAGGPIVSSSQPAQQEKAEGNKLGLGLFANGILFGLQPDALFVIVPALTLPTKLAACAYISMFVVGTVAAMGGYTAVIGATSKAIQERNPWLTTNLSALASCVAVFFGVVVLVGS